MTVEHRTARAMGVLLRNVTYQLGTGGYNKRSPDQPETRHHKTKLIGCDCSGFAISYVHEIPRSLPGFGKYDGEHQTHVVDDVNTDSTLYDARYNRTRFELVEGVPRIGDLLIIPGRFSVAGERTGIGHVLYVIGVPAEWDVNNPQWDLLQVIHCRGPNGKRPGVIVSDANVCTRHDAKWKQVPEMRTQIVRWKGPS